MATLQDLLGVLNTIDSAQLTAILALVSLVLILLIFLAFRRKDSESTVEIAEAENKLRNRDSESAPYRPQPQARTHSDEPVIAPEIKPAPRPVTTETPASVVDKPVIRTDSSPKTTQVPQDSVLRRHYQANLEAERQARTNPYPTDSVLRRHYDALHRLVLESSRLTDNVRPAAREVRQSSAKASIIEQAIGKEAAESSKVIKPAAKITIPQDSVLKRHFIHQLRAEIEAEFSPRPSDSVLRRHYDSLIGRELEKRLAG